MHSPKQKLGLPWNTGDLGLKTRIDMQSHLMREMQCLGDDAMTMTTNQYGKNCACMEGQVLVSDTKDHPPKCTSSTDLELSKSTDNELPAAISRVADLPQNASDDIPIGIPLPKPPVLPNVSQAVAHDSGSLNIGSVGHDEQLTDDESAVDKSTYLCDSKIYEIGEQRHHSLPRMVHYKSINTDEMIFLEAACALSRVGVGVRHVLDMTFEQSLLPPLTQQPHSKRANPLRNIALLDMVASTSKKENEIMINATLRKRRPIGPPPFTLSKIQKTILP